MSDLPEQYITLLGIGKEKNLRPVTMLTGYLTGR